MNSLSPLPHPASHTTPPRLPRHHTLPVSVKKKKKDWRKKKSRRRLVSWSERALVTLRWWFPLFLVFISEEWFWRRLMILRGFTLCSDWLCVVRNRKWVAVTNTMMTQRLFHDFFLFVHFKVFFSFLLNYFNTQVDFVEACRRQRVGYFHCCMHEVIMMMSHLYLTFN